MDDAGHVARLRQGVDAWNDWRTSHPALSPDLRAADLQGANLNLADLSGADLRKADLRNAQLDTADLRGARLEEADFRYAILMNANLRGADLRRANLRFANLLDADISDADLTGAFVYGASVWKLTLNSTTKQDNLVVTEFGQSEVTVDRIEVAQFVYLLLHNEKIRDVIDTVGRKGVLLLGRFTEDRIEVLERLRLALRQRGFVPMVFNFDKPETKDFTDTVRLLAGMSHFVIVDMTKPRSVPLELQATVPDCMVPFVPILQKGEEPFAMFRDLWIKHRAWVLDPIRYPSVDRLIEVLDAEIIAPAQARFAELLAAKAEALPIRDI